MAYQLVEAPASFSSEEDKRIFFEARRVLWEHVPFRDTRPPIALRVEQGVVHLTGRVRSRPLKVLATYLLEQVPGVQRVQNDLIADPDLEIAVAEALEQDPELAPLCIRVYARHGVVRLEGHVPSADLERRAVERASQVPGVAELRSELTVDA
jgi:osmotically-inducible protein OsmY